LNLFLNHFRKYNIFQYVCSGIVILSLVIISLTGCARIPKESVLLSEELTGMIRSARTSHLGMLDVYMTERRAKADSFMVKKWIPTFLDEAVNSWGVLGDLDKAETNSEKGQIMLDFADEALGQIYIKQVEITQALDEIERSLKDAIEAHYADMLTVNQALTAHLQSAAEVTAIREELLQKFNVDPEKMIPFDKLNPILEKIITFEEKAGKISALVDSAKTVIKGGKE
jgi:hypothetical protein